MAVVTAEPVDGNHARATCRRAGRDGDRFPGVRTVCTYPTTASYSCGNHGSARAEFSAASAEATNRNSARACFAASRANRGENPNP